MRPAIRAIILVTAVAVPLLLFAACNGGNTPAANPTATVTVEVPSGKSPNTSVKGTVNYRERIALPPGARLEVELRDTSLQDVASVLIAKQTIMDPGQVPIAFEIEYNSDDINDRNTYSIQARIIWADGRLGFINDTATDVITRGNPTRVDMQLVLVQPPPDLAAQVDGDHRTWVEAPVQVIRANLIPNEQDPFLRIEFYQSGVENCARPGNQSLEVEGTVIAATLTLQQPPDVPWDTGCAAEFLEMDAIEPITAELKRGVQYTVTVNGAVVSTFSLPREGLEISAIAESPIQNVTVAEMESDPVQYALEVISGRPSGSCTQVNGYEIQRKIDNTINVLVTHHQNIERDVICTADFPIEETMVPLGTLEEGVEYTVTVNGEHTQAIVGK